MNGCQDREAKDLTKVCKGETYLNFFLRENIFPLFVSSAVFYHEQQRKKQKLSIAEFTFPFVFAREEEEGAENFKPGLCGEENFHNEEHVNALIVACISKQNKSVF